VGRSSCVRNFLKVVLVICVFYLIVFLSRVLLCGGACGSGRLGKKIFLNSVKVSNFRCQIFRRVVSVNQVSLLHFCEVVVKVKCCCVVVWSRSGRSSWVRIFFKKLSRSVRSGHRIFFGCFF
jgi:hypothetical protein